MGLAVHIFYPEVDVFGLVARFHSKFSSDPDLDGCLLELEEILKLRDNLSMEASVVKKMSLGHRLSIRMTSTFSPTNIITKYDQKRPPLAAAVSAHKSRPSKSIKGERKSRTRR